MPLVILKSSYVKSLTHFVNLITYCDSKVEAQMAVGADGALRQMTIEEILRLAPDKEIKLQLGNGRTVATTVERFALRYAEKNIEEHYQTEVYTDDNTEREFQADKWIKYIANRPSSKGLFNQFGAIDEDEAVRLAEEHFDSIKWSHIVSLERADAERLGYDNPQAWQTLIAAKLPDIAKLHNISLENIIVNASYHDKDHHPHIHLFVYSRDSSEGRFKGTDALIERTGRIRSLFTNEIFRGDLEHIKANKNEMQTQIRQALRQKCIAIAQKKHMPSNELIERFSEISNIMLDSKGRRYYEYQNAEVKAKINDLLECAVKSDKYINQIYMHLRSNQEEFVRAYNDDEEKISVRMKEWEKRFFAPKKSDDKRLHNIIIEYASKITDVDTACSDYVLSQNLWEIVPGICAYAEAQLSGGEISFNECAAIKDNVQDFAKVLAAKLSRLEDEELIEKEFDRQYTKITNKLLNERLMSSRLTLSMYTPDEFAETDNVDDINAAHYVHRIDMPAKKQKNLYFTAQNTAKTFCDILGGKAIGSVLVLHNEDAARAFLITGNGKCCPISGSDFAVKAASDGLLPKRYALFDEEPSVDMVIGTKEKRAESVPRKTDPAIAMRFAEKYSALQTAVIKNKDIFYKVLQINKALKSADYELNAASLSRDARAALTALCQRLSEHEIKDADEDFVLRWLNKSGGEVISNALCEQAGFDSVNYAVYKAISDSFDDPEQNLLEVAVCGMSEFPKKYSECDEVQKSAVNRAVRMCLADGTGRQALDQFNERLANAAEENIEDPLERKRILDDIRKRIITPENYGKMQGTVLHLSHRAPALQYNARIKRCKDASAAVNKAVFRELGNEKYIKRLIELNDMHDKDYQPKIAVMPKNLQNAAKEIFREAYDSSPLLKRYVDMLENAYNYDEKCFPKILSPNFREHFFEGRNGEIQSHCNTVFSAAASAIRRTHNQVLKQNEYLGELKTALRNALLPQDRTYINSISQGRPYQLLDPDEKASLNTMLKTVVLSNQETLNAFEKVNAEQNRLYCEKFDAQTAAKLASYTRKALFEPQQYELSPIQNAAAFCTQNHMRHNPHAGYVSKMLLFRLAAEIAQAAQRNPGKPERDQNQKRRRKSGPSIERAHNRNISAENSEENSGFEYN